MKIFPYNALTKTSDFLGYNRSEWSLRTHRLHLEQVSRYKQARTATKQELERLHGVRYSELLRLPCLDTVEYHVVHPMYNLLLGTAKNLMALWKEEYILDKANFVDIQDEVNEIKVPCNVGRIPYKIASNFSSFTADQWKNWILIYSAVFKTAVAWITV